MIHPDKLFGRLGNRMFQMAFLYAEVLRGNLPDIYLQDPKYFSEYKDHIRWLFTQDVGQTNQVSIHVRRGDYVDNPFYVDLTKTDYYENAMAMFTDEDFLVFSDDIEWCKKQDIFTDCEFSVEKDEIKDFNLMASCKAHIIANSSFSWWASYIGGGKTIAPKLWYRDGVERTKVPDNWIKI